MQTNENLFAVSTFFGGIQLALQQKKLSYNFYFSILILIHIIKESPRWLKAIACSTGGSTESSFWTLIMGVGSVKSQLSLGTIFHTAFASLSNGDCEKCLFLFIRVNFFDWLVQ